jgi:hypothetical protein
MNAVDDSGFGDMAGYINNEFATGDDFVRFARGDGRGYGGVDANGSGGGGDGVEDSSMLQSQQLQQYDALVGNSNMRPREGPLGANLFIYHLPHDLTDADLTTLFAENPFGQPISAKVGVGRVSLSYTTKIEKNEIFMCVLNYVPAGLYG